MAILVRLASFVRLASLIKLTRLVKYWLILLHWLVLLDLLVLLVLLDCFDFEFGAIGFIMVSSGVDHQAKAEHSSRVSVFRLMILYYKMWLKKRLT